MRALRRARRLGEIPDTLILVEHPPVVTVGVQGDDGEVLPEGIPSSGSNAAARGPTMDRASWSDTRSWTSTAAAGTSDGSSTTSRRSWPVPSARSGSPQAESQAVGASGSGELKIASVGVAIEEWVSFHGFALNVSTDLGPFGAFHPCGLPGSVMTSVSRELGRTVEVATMKAPVLRAWDAVFGTPPQARAGGPTPIAAAPVV